MYTPKLREELVSRLYAVAKVRGQPMTVVLNRLVREALDRATSVSDREDGACSPQEGGPDDLRNESDRSTGPAL